MAMFTSYDQIKKRKEKNRFFDDFSLIDSLKNTILCWSYNGIPWHYNDIDIIALKFFLSITYILIVFLSYFLNMWMHVRNTKYQKYYCSKSVISEY